MLSTCNYGIGRSRWADCSNRPSRAYSAVVQTKEADHAEDVTLPASSLEIPFMLAFGLMSTNAQDQ